ncbi:PucR family transcriptional regulator [Paenibacillus massiliensis]|uniref:PucR family transcriptional regulator n=1 Tax=Paenibacillus massiliensis TaxID=225917 RepID=UPI0003740013|nr:PucR family transcriptional regulator [Paenibacillus massiliensis]
MDEALNRPVFQGAYLIAGQAGTTRPIRWVHILETEQFDSLIHGGEMILTTGIGMQADMLTFINRLIHSNAACLCVELGLQCPAIPEDVIVMANEQQFPLVVFPHTVRFVDITLDLHSLLLTEQQRKRRELEHITREFHRLTLMPQGSRNVLRLLHESIGRPLVYRPLVGKAIFLPANLAKDHLHWLQIIEEFHCTAAPLSTEQMGVIHAPVHTKEASGQQSTMALPTLAIRPIGALGQTWAHLAFLHHGDDTADELSLLDSAALSIAQELLRSHTLEDRRWSTHQQWLQELVEGQIRDERQLMGMIGPDYHALNERPYRIAILEHEAPSSNIRADVSSSLSQFAPSLRHILEQAGYRLWITASPNRVILFITDPQLQHDKERLLQTLSGITGPKGTTGTIRNTEHNRHTDSISIRDTTGIRNNTSTRDTTSSITYNAENASIANPRQRISPNNHLSSFAGTPTSQALPMQIAALIIGVSHVHTGLAAATAAYQEGVQALNLYPCIRQPLLFYEDLGIFQLLPHLNDGHTLQRFIASYLGPLISHDEIKGSELLLTLKVYLDNDGSKQMAARQLFIVRQSLYYRLDKITELLGAEFMQAEHRLSIQVAIRAYQLLYPEKLKLPNRTASLQQ